jgi:hypothetical protein
LLTLELPLVEITLFEDRSEALRLVVEVEAYERRFVEIRGQLDRVAIAALEHGELIVGRVAVESDFVIADVAVLLIDEVMVGETVTSRRASVGKAVELDGEVE